MSDSEESCLGLWLHQQLIEAIGGRFEQGVAEGLFYAYTSANGVCGSLQLCVGARVGHTCASEW